MPSKADYRHFNVKTVEGINDFATMKEVVYRRYKSVLAEDQPLAKLIIIDGGKGQLSAAMESINELGLNGKQQLWVWQRMKKNFSFPATVNLSNCPGTVTA
jgi:excinuclease ABC subunit C